MLTAIELRELQSIRERTRIELARITLIFGENSAGKSSILQSLNLLKQTMEGQEAWGPLYCLALTKESSIQVITMSSFSGIE